MAASNVSLARDAAQIAALLDSPEIAALISHLEATRWTGRPGYSVRSMIGLVLVKSVYALPTWTRTVALVRDHAGLRDVLGAVPSTDAAYRFTAKLREHKDLLAACIAKVLTALHSAHPEMGGTIAIDGSDLPAYGSGQRYVKRGGELRKRFADPDASLGPPAVNFHPFRRRLLRLQGPLHRGHPDQTGLPVACRWRRPRTLRSRRCRSCWTR